MGKIAAALSFVLSLAAAGGDGTRRIDRGSDRMNGGKRKKGEKIMANIVRRTEATPSVATSEWDPFRLMRDMLRWDPFKEMLPFAPSTGNGGIFHPSFEVMETKGSYVFKADLPGVAESDLEISFTGNRLTV